MKNDIIIQCYVGGKSPDYHRYFALYHSGLRVLCVGNHQCTQEKVTKTLMALNSDDLRNVNPLSYLDNAHVISEIENLLNLMSLYRFGSFKLNVTNGMIDFFHPDHRISFKFKDEVSGYGRIPESGQYSDKQKMTIHLLSQVPFLNGEIEIPFSEGQPSGIIMTTSDYIRAKK